MALKVNPDLAAERRSASFNSRQLGIVLAGGLESFQKRENIRTFVESHSDLQDLKPICFMGPEERLENAARKFTNLRKYVLSGELDIIGDPAAEFYVKCLVIGLEEPFPYGLHFVMFLPLIRAQMTEEQQEKWLSKALTLAIVGTYAQTELGHGTNVRGLETTATYDVETQEFVLNTPTLTAMKWWPGNLGKSSTHAVVMAQLWTRAKNYGPHPFLVPLRHLDSHQVFKGVTVGDIGPTFGYVANDNGYLAFDNYRIPRENMPMKYAKVLKDGTYVAPPHKKMAYGTMVHVRSVMITGEAIYLAAAATIATRYSSIRRQGEIELGKGEVQVLDYQTQQYRILPELAKAYAYYFVGQTLQQIYLETMAQIQSGKTGALAELHALSSGIKGELTWQVSRGIEQCRLACGGHGYSHASGLPDLYANVVGSCTYEGDNIVMLLQLARFLVKTVRQLGESGGDTSCLDVTTVHLGRTGPRRDRLNGKFQFHTIVELFEVLARRLAFRVVDYLDEQTRKAGGSAENAWNLCGVELCKAAKAHVRYFVARTFVDKLKTVEEASIRRVLTQVCQLYLSSELLSRSGALLECGVLTSEEVQHAKNNLYASLKALRPEAAALADAWQLSDVELRSVLGRFDGNVYENMINFAKHSELNKHEVLPAYHKYLGPMMKEARSKL